MCYTIFQIDEWMALGKANVDKNAYFFKKCPKK